MDDAAEHQIFDEQQEVVEADEVPGDADVLAPAVARRRHEAAGGAEQLHDRDLRHEEEPPRLLVDEEGLDDEIHQSP